MPLVAAAQDDAQQHAQAQLISATTGVGKLPVLDMGLDIALNDGFYTYWKMPGDNGLAPTFDWSGSTNVKDVAVSWPTPKRITLMDMNSFGYEQGVLFPLAVTPQEPGKAVTLKLKLTLMVCHDICIPQETTIERTFAEGDSVKSDSYTKIEEAKKRLPARDNTARLGIDTTVLGKDAVVVTAFAKQGFGENADLIIETPNSMLTAKPEITPPAAKGDKYVMKVKGPDKTDLTKELFGKTVQILLINGEDAVEKTVTF